MGNDSAFYLVGCYFNTCSEINQFIVSYDSPNTKAITQ